MKIAGLKTINYVEIKSGNRELSYSLGTPPFAYYYNKNGKTKIINISHKRYWQAVNKYVPECKFNGGDFVKYDTQEL